YRVFWNFAWTITDNMRFRELRVSPDWEFIGREYYEQLQSQPGGAIIPTAHMGSYDLGAHLFAEKSGRQIVMIRAPETDAQTRAFEESHASRTAAELKIDFNTSAGDLALDLLPAMKRGGVVAVHGVHVTLRNSEIQATMLCKPMT